MSRKNLLVASGRSREKKLCFPGDTEWSGALVTVDMNPDCGVDVVHDMAQRPFPFADGEFDEIHAYDCLEHWGAQGDWRAWFDEMAEYHRILKPGGKFAAIVPIGEDRFADPGHTRFFSLNHFLFLNQQWYEEQAMMNTSAADYRWYWKLNFHVLAANRIGGEAGEHHLGVMLQKDGFAPLYDEPNLLERLARNVLSVVS